MQVRVRRGDTVEVVRGRDKGMRGEVLRVLPKHGRVVVQGANLRKKHQRQVQAGGRTMSPGIIQFEASMDLSNVMVVCPSCNEASRVAVERTDGVRRRICKNCGKPVDA